MRLYIVLDDRKKLRCICKKQENAEFKVPQSKRYCKEQQANRTDWLYGRSNKWLIRPVEVQGEIAPGTKAEFVYVTGSENDFELFATSADAPKEAREIRIVDANGLSVVENN